MLDSGLIFIPISLIKRLNHYTTKQHKNKQSALSRCCCKLLNLANCNAMEEKLYKALAAAAKSSRQYTQWYIYTRSRLVKISNSSESTSHSAKSNVGSKKASENCLDRPPSEYYKIFSNHLGEGALRVQMDFTWTYFKPTPNATI